MWRADRTTNQPDLANQLEACGPTDGSTGARSVRTPSVNGRPVACAQTRSACRSSSKLMVCGDITATAAVNTPSWCASTSGSPAANPARIPARCASPAPAVPSTRTGRTGRCVNAVPSQHQLPRARGHGKPPVWAELCQRRPHNGFGFAAFSRDPRQRRGLVQVQRQEVNLVEPAGQLDDFSRGEGCNAQKAVRRAQRQQLLPCLQRHLRQRQRDPTAGVPGKLRLGAGDPARVHRRASRIVLGDVAAAAVGIDQAQGVERAPPFGPANVAQFEPDLRHLGE